MKMAKLTDFDRNEYGSTQFELSTGCPQVIHRKFTGYPHIHRKFTGYPHIHRLSTEYPQSYPQCSYFVFKLKRETKVLYNFGLQNYLKTEVLLYRITVLAQNSYNNLTVTICYIWLQLILGFAK